MNVIVYILRTSANTLYVGQTNNLQKRLVQHMGQKKGAKYLRAFSSFELVYQEVCVSRSAALKREYQIKSYTKKQKENLIARSSLF